MNRESSKKETVMSSLRTPNPDSRTPKICIIGMGLLGGSLGKAIKVKFPKSHVFGVVHNPKDISKVKKLNACDDASTDLMDGIRDAQWIILATPPMAFEPYLKQISKVAQSHQIVTDVGSVKQSVMLLYKKYLKRRIPYIGSHPVAGSEKKGIDVSRADLFKNATCVITPDSNSSEDLIRKCSRFWKSVGTNPIVISAAEHDEIFAYISHVPHLVSYCLANTVLGKEKYIKFAGEAWRQMTRVANSTPGLWAEILVMNKKNILKSLSGIIRDLQLLRQNLKTSDFSAIKQYFEHAREGLKSE